VEIREMLFKLAQCVPDTLYRGLFQQTGCRTQTFISCHTESLHLKGKG